ncbi:MAG: hypothetical protein KC478_14945 [Bacteriovoracaceae bacterium]|nr:hypothetical protein [Bacteriovoracaceae bacterium]
MQFRIVKVSIFLAMYSFSAFSSSCDEGGQVELNLNDQLKPHIEQLQSVTEAFRLSLSEPDIRSCIVNTRKLEKIQKSRLSIPKVLDFYTAVLRGHKKVKERIIGAIKLFRYECEQYNENCRSASYQEEKLQEEVQKETETKLEVVKYINKGLALKVAEEEMRASFDVDCHKQKFDKNLVEKICSKYYSFDAPICRDRYKESL